MTEQVRYEHTDPDTHELCDGLVVFQPASRIGHILLDAYYNCPSCGRRFRVEAVEEQGHD